MERKRNMEERKIKLLERGEKRTIGTVGNNSNMSVPGARMR